ncbi:MAG: hypothetical protein IKG93_06770 [Clostridiales bacterium]|nr:hypothetical protein [Clostridiales bacterium]
MKTRKAAALILAAMMLTSCGKKASTSGTSNENRQASTSASEQRVKDPDLLGNPDTRNATKRGLMTSLDEKNPLIKEIYSCYCMKGMGMMYTEIVAGTQLTVEAEIRDESAHESNEITLMVFPYNSEYAWNKEEAIVSMKGAPCNPIVGENYETIHVFWIQGDLPTTMKAGKYSFVFVRNDGKVDSVMDLDVIDEDDAKEPLTVDKPVIYLYPEEETEVSVQIELQGELACTYPKYDPDFGWKVTANPDGKIKNHADGRNYDYLFWEGKTDFELDKFENAVCVAGEDTARFLEEYLTACGLNDSEIDDFVSFWLPKMEKNPYNMIAFPISDYEEMAKLNVYPQPDTEIRVFMVFRALDEAADLPSGDEMVMPQGVVREGFTLVEWGGTEV